VKAPGSVTFNDEELGWIEDARLILMGVPPSELGGMEPELRMAVFEIHAAEASLRNRKV
jgi:hypothetical protein